MGHALVTPAVEHREGPSQLAGQVVGREDRHLAGVSQLRPIMAMYIQLIGRMLALPQGAALTALLFGSRPGTGTTGWLATKGCR